MIKKNPLVFALFFCVLLYMAYKAIIFFSLNSQITFDKDSPPIQLSEMIPISNDRIIYQKSFYIKKKFVGFNAIIDKNYFITVTKLGKVYKGFRIVKTDKKPDNSSDINIFENSDVEDENSRYIDLHNYPFNIKQIYYYVDGADLTINESKFYEIEGTFTFFNISFNGETRKEFGYAGLIKKKSVSFLEYKGDLYVLNTFPIKNANCKSLHELSNF